MRRQMDTESGVQGAAGEERERQREGGDFSGRGHRQLHQSPGVPGEALNRWGSRWLPSVWEEGEFTAEQQGPPDGGGRRATPRWLLSLSSEPVLPASVSRPDSSPLQSPQKPGPQP